LEAIEIPVRFRGVDYILTDADEDTAVKFRNHGLRSAKMSEGSVVGVTGGAEVELILVAGCLFKINPKVTGGRERVQPDDLKKWPSRVIKPLFEKAKEISELNEATDLPSIDRQIERLQKLRARIVEKEKAVKNAPSATQATLE
jgi:hypothetical protein